MRKMGEFHCLTLEGAWDMARKIEAYWIAHGYYGIRCEVIQEGSRYGALPVVRSNMINGWPPKMADGKPREF